MNSTKQVDAAHIPNKTKHVLEALSRTGTQPRLKHRFIVLASWALVTYTSNATQISYSSDREHRDLKTFHPGTRVWVEKGTHKVNVDSRGVILKGYDPVTYFTQNKAVKGSPKYQSTYQGATYYFGSAADLATFKRNPSKYVPQYGGFCAYHVSKRELKDSDPTAFFIYKGKLYVCSAADSAKEFRSNIDKNIRKADDYWLPPGRAAGQPYNRYGPR
jgi:YHS domain-containing protein